jgi:hypothetical protein
MPRVVSAIGRELVESRRVDRHGLPPLTRFERGSGAALIDSPWRKAAVLIRNARGIQSASDGCRPPGRSTFHLADGGRTRSPCPKAPSVFKTAPATRPVHHPGLFGHQGGIRTRSLRLRRATLCPVELRDGMREAFMAPTPDARACYRSPGLLSGAPGWTRTSDRPVMSRRLWPLSYKRDDWSGWQASILRPLGSEPRALPD